MLRTVSGTSLGYQTVMGPEGTPDGEDAFSAGSIVIPRVPAQQDPLANTEPSSRTARGETSDGQKRITVRLRMKETPFLIGYRFRA
jgi:hypothetical protein